MPDWLDDPRVSKLPFMKLKKYIRQSTPDISKQDLDSAGTKFALLHIADEKKIALEDLFDEVGPPPSQRQSPRVISHRATTPSPRQMPSQRGEAKAKAAKAAEEVAKAKATEEAAKAKAAQEASKAKQVQETAKAKGGEASKAKAAQEAGKGKAAAVPSLRSREAGKAADEAGRPGGQPARAPIGAAAAGAGSSDSFRLPQTSMDDRMVPMPGFGGQQRGSQQRKLSTPLMSSRLNELAAEKPTVTRLHEDKTEDVGERLFVSLGETMKFAKGDVMITEGVPTDQAMYISSGDVSLRRGAKEVKRASSGFIIGEMTLLLGDDPNVSVVAETPVEVVVVDHALLVEALVAEPLLSGRVFKMFAVIISERIGDTSKRARDEVVVHKPKSSSAPKNGQGASTFTAKEIAKYQLSFNLAKDDVLRLKTTFDSVQKEANAKKEDSVQYGELYVFDRHLCFEFRIFGFVKQQVLPFADVVSLLNAAEKPNEIEVQGKGFSYVLSLPESQTNVWGVMEACRRAAGAKARRTTNEKHDGEEAKASFEQIDAQVADAFNDAVRMTTAGERDSISKGRNAFLSMQLTNEDWGLFLSGAKQRKYKHGEFVLREGDESAALFQILQGTVRVELQLKDQPTAVVVGHRGPGEMFGETSLLKSGQATASIVVESDEATLVCVDGAYLEKLFTSHASLPGRFFAFLASYQAGRLRRLTASITSGVVEVAGHGAADIPIEEIFSNQAFLGIFNKFLTNTTPDGDDIVKHKQSIAAFDFYNDVKERYKTEPDHGVMQAEANRILSTFIVEGAPRMLTFLSGEKRASIQAAIASFAAAVGTSSGVDEGRLREARAIFDETQTAAVETIRSYSYADFLASEHLLYIQELKAKEGMVPGLPDFRLLRVLGEGGFGQVLEVVKRDSGKHYAMKMMHKDLMRKCFASSWRQKIWLEKDLMASLNHPFMVNLAYAFQNPVFLVLVMDLVPGGDLSDYVLTKKRLTVDQVRTVIMETVCVIHYCHLQMVLYRDLKPENLLIDEFGHIRLIDMGLATRMTKSMPRRMSRVGTECYMAPEVRWAKDRREPYGVSADWYTVGVLLYEFSAGDLPYDNPEAKVPTYSEFKFPDKRAEDLVKQLLNQDHTKRLGCGAEGIEEIKRHPYWNGVEWDLVPLKKFESPCKGLKEGKSSKKKRQEKENAAIEVAAEYAAADVEADQSAPVSNWDFVAPTAIIDEYMENMYHCVSAI